MEELAGEACLFMAVGLVTGDRGYVTSGMRQMTCEEKKYNLIFATIRTRQEIHCLL